MATEIATTEISLYALVDDPALIQLLFELKFSHTWLEFFQRLNHTSFLPLTILGLQRWITFLGQEKLQERVQLQANPLFYAQSR